MEKINLQGITAYWDLSQGKAVDAMQETLRDKYHFTQSIKELSRIVKNAEGFVQGFQQDVISDLIRIYDGERQVSIIDGSTPLDYAYSCGINIGNHLKSAFVNGQEVDICTTLGPGDRVHLILSQYPIGPLPEWLEKVATVQARRIIEVEMRKKNGVRKRHR